MSSKVRMMFHSDDCKSCKFCFHFRMGKGIEEIKRDIESGIRVEIPVIHHAYCCLLQFTNAATAVESNNGVNCHVIPCDKCPRCVGAVDMYPLMQMPDVQFSICTEMHGDEVFHAEDDVYKNDLNARYKYYVQLIREQAEKYFLEHMSRGMLDKHRHVEVEFEL